MLETQISPIFGLTLIHLVEVLTIISLLGVFLTGFFLYMSYKKQSKTTSADISLRLIETVRRTEFRDTISKIKENKKTEYSDIRRVLNHYEYLAYFEKDGILDYSHVLHQHGGTLNMLYKNKQVMDVFNSERQGNTQFVYVNLSNLFIKIKNDVG